MTKRFDDVITDRACPKCGTWPLPQILWTTEYHSGQSVTCPAEWYGKEHLKLTCPICGWFFNMDVADAE